MSGTAVPLFKEIEGLIRKYNIDKTSPEDRIKQVNIYFDSQVMVEITKNGSLWYGLELK